MSSDADGGESATDGGGQAGAPEPHECKRDRECDNGSACDGQESCVNGACEQGVPLTCPFDTMACVDEAAACVFDSPSPWLVFGTGSTLEALPTRLIGVSPPIVLATQSLERAMGFVGATFSARGELALTLSADEEFLARLQITHFGAGTPGPLQDLPEVPTLTSSYPGPWLASDSSYALVLDDVAGAFFAPLADPDAETIRIPISELDIDEADYCDEAPSFWYREQSGATGIATPEPHGLHRRPTGGTDTPVFSRNRRFLAQMLPETDDTDPSGHGVVVSRCARQGADVVFEEASSPIISPMSDSLLLQYSDGTRRLFSLEDPEARLELWSSEETALDGATFSADGTSIVGLVDDVIHVAQLSEAPTLAPIGLPPGTTLATAWVHTRNYVPLVGTTALLARLPDEEGVSGPLVWQSLTPGRKVEQLLSPTEAAKSSLMLSGDDVNEVFIATTLAGAREQLLRVRLDTKRALLEPLLTLEGEINGVERAPDDSGLLVSLGTRELTSASWWIPLSADKQAGEPLLLNPHTYGASFQPRP